MVDALFDDIRKGDFVLVTCNNYLVIRIVIQTTPRTATLKMDKNAGNMTTMSPDHLIRLTDEQVYDLSQKSTQKREWYAASHLQEAAQTALKYKQKLINNNEL